MPLRSWLLSAFDPFLNRPANHSMQVLDAIQKLNRDPALEIHTVLLPTEYDRCEGVLLAEIAKLNSQGVQLTGVLSIGEGHEDFVIETQANNLDHSAQEDNVGIVRTQQKIFQNRDDILKMDFPVDRFKIQKSLNPGFFVCNHLCARMMVAREKDPTLPVFGFVHVPRHDLTHKFSTEDCARSILAGL